MNTARRGNHSNLAPNQFTRQWRQLIKLILGPAVFDCDILALTKAAVLKPLTKCAEQMRVRGGRCTVKKSDPRLRRLLRARPKRPRGRRAAEQRDELASPHGHPSSGLGPHISTPLCNNVAVHHSKNCALMSQMGQ